MLEQDNYSDTLAKHLNEDKINRNATFGKTALTGLSVFATLYIGQVLERSGVTAAQVVSLIPAYVLYDRCRRLLFEGVEQSKDVRRATKAQSSVAFYEPRIQSSIAEIVTCFETAALSDAPIKVEPKSEVDVIQRLIYDVGVAMINGRFIFIEGNVQSDGEVTTYNSVYQSAIHDESLASQDGTEFQIVFKYSSSSGHIDAVTITRRTIWSFDTKSSMNIHSPRAIHKGSTGFVNEVVSLVQLTDGTSDDHEHCTYHPQLIDELLLCGYQIECHSGKSDKDIVFTPSQKCKPWGGYKSDEPIVFYLIGVLNGNKLYAVTHKKSGFLK